MKRIFLITILTFAGISKLIAQQNSIPTNGNVGIGTTTPVTKLQVKGNAQIDSMLQVKDSILIHKNARIKKNLIVEKDVRFTSLDSVNTLGNKNFIVIRPNGKLEQIDKLEIANQIGDLIYEPKNNCPSGDILHPVWWNGTNKIYNNCPQVNFGLGTDAPTYKLHVIGSTYSASYQGENASISQRLEVGTNQINTNSFAKLFIKNNTNNAGIMIDQTALNADYAKILYAEISNTKTEIIKVQNSLLNYTPFLLSSSGAMEIHNGTRKTFQLDADGLLKTRRIIVDQDEWPDYVFDKNYTLMPLQEVEKYILSNKHLPEVPSEQETETNGSDLGEMNAILLKKIEELTLYLIEQDKKLTQQALELEEIKKQLR